MFRAQYTMTSSAPPAELLTRLQAQVEPRKSFRFLNFNHLAFEGEVRGEQFSIRRIIHYKNSFRPNIEGKIEAAGSGSVVRVSFVFHPVIVVFTGIWLVMFVLAMLSIIVLAIATKKSELFLGTAFIPIVLVVFLGFAGAFWYEVKKARRILENLFR